MSATSTPGSASAPKSMSSRLLTMKFMQRAAASPPSSPSTPDEPPTKRRKKGTDSSPSKFDVDALADQRAIQKALADEEAKRQAALDRQAAEAGDTRWVLSFEDQKQTAASSALALRVVQTGYANLDSLPSLQVRSMEEEQEDKPIVVGRRSYGKFNKVLEKQQDPEAEDSSESVSDEDDDESNSGGESDNDDPSKDYYNDSRETEAMDRLKKQRKAQKHKEKAALLKQGKDRKKKEVNLNGLTSLSGKATPQKGPCHQCGGPHFKRECPELSGGDGSRLKGKRGFQGGDEGPPRKTIRAR
ncbi:hypothetical protein LSUB1_G007804 [Lachnellula subtilissima]|uniref:Uncharacterized protein n=1 Tax=Lachnellula subtilissima TaxID=602034 RepID=A0A8H8U690_9HELO|nr:hypothetical protein LSUB1_G007804 [Lachnellula subtilissima]